MLPRVIALLLALVTFWSGFVPQDAAASITPAAVLLADAASAAELDTPVSDIPVDEQPVEELPAQALAEGAMDAPGLFRACPDTRIPALTMARPRPYAAVAWLAPYLDGPQRPPCASPRLA